MPSGAQAEGGKENQEAGSSRVEGDKLYLQVSGPLQPHSAFANCRFTSPCTWTRKMALPPPLSSSQTSVVIQLEKSFLPGSGGLQEELYMAISVNGCN